MHEFTACSTTTYRQGHPAWPLPVDRAGGRQCLSWLIRGHDRIGVDTGRGHLDGGPQAVQELQYSRKQHCADGGICRRVAGCRRHIYHSCAHLAGLLECLRLLVGHGHCRARRLARRAVHDPATAFADCRAAACLPGRQGDGRGAEGRTGSGVRHQISRHGSVGWRVDQILRDRPETLDRYRAGGTLFRSGHNRLCGHQPVTGADQCRFYRRPEYCRAHIRRRRDFLVSRYPGLLDLLS